MKKFVAKYATGESPLVDAVMEEMKKQIEVGDWTAIDELLRYVPIKNLINFLPEEDWNKYKE
jgi:hypothetical protein